MPKLKTNRGAAKRFKKTGNGYKHRCANRNHILTKKSQGRKRALRAMGVVKKCDEKSIIQMLGD
jgi:large subunit ribosomal protein L35